MSLSCLPLPFLCFIPVFCNWSLFSTPQQLGCDPQSWTEVYAVLKGTSLSCYHRQEDVGANVEPAFTIAINKVSITRRKTHILQRLISLYRSHTVVLLLVMPQASATRMPKKCCQFESHGNWLLLSQIWINKKCRSSPSSYCSGTQLLKLSCVEAKSWRLCFSSFKLSGLTV